MTDPTTTTTIATEDILPIRDTTSVGPVKLCRLEDFTTIYVLGSGSAGKTSLINRLLEKTGEVPKPTLGLDYNYARRTVHKPDISQYPVKQICNIWELGGDAAKFPDLIETPILACHGLPKMAIFLVLDLSNPVNIWPTLDACIRNLKKGVARAVSQHSNSNEVSKVLDEAQTKRLGDAVQDRSFLDPLPLPLVLVLTKWEEFMGLEPERRKTTCRLLRLVAHRLGASLNTYAENDVASNRRVRELLFHYAFLSPRFPKESCFDFNKGLQIPHGGDAYERIWPEGNPSQFTLEYFGHLWETQIGKASVEATKKEEVNPCEDPNFFEPVIDSQRAVLLEELRIMEETLKEQGDVGNIYLVQEDLERI